MHHSNPLTSRYPTSPEPLEPRIAPAALLHVSDDHKSATWIDVDGDTVTLKASKPVLNDADFKFLAPAAGDVGQQLALLDLHSKGVAANGVGLTFSAKRTSKLGDGSVNVGRINAAGVDLGAVIIPGDLGSIEAGDGDPATAALVSIVTNSTGAFHGSTQSATINGQPVHVGWLFNGRIGPVTVKGDFVAQLDVKDNSDQQSAFSAAASTGPITIWGSVLGDDEGVSAFANQGEGSLFCEGNMGAVKILGDVDSQGVALSYAASVIALGNIASVSVGGDLVGGNADDTGEIYAAHALGKVTVNGSIAGGFTSTDANGKVAVDSNGNPIVVHSAGAIGSAMKIDAVTVRGNITPGYGKFTGAIYTEPGSAGDIKSVSIGGTLRGYTFQFVSYTYNSVNHTDVALPAFNGLYADGRLGPVKVGAIAGQSPLSPVPIAALGKANPQSAAEALAIASVTVLRGASAVEILAGYNANREAVNPDVQIGAIKVGGAFIGSSISAGVSADSGEFGGNNNVLAPANADFSDSVAILSRILSVTVGTYVQGPGSGPQSSTGLVAQDIGTVKLGLTTLEMTLTTPTVRDLFTLGPTHDFFVREVV